MSHPTERTSTIGAQSSSAPSTVHTPDSEYDRDDGAGLVSSGGECVGCGRIMSIRERNEQGVCDGCSEGSDK